MHGIALGPNKLACRTQPRCPRLQAPGYANPLQRSLYLQPKKATAVFAPKNAAKKGPPAAVGAGSALGTWLMHHRNKNALSNVFTLLQTLRASLPQLEKSFVAQKTQQLRNSIETVKQVRIN